MEEPQEPILSRAQSRELDRLAREEFGIPSLLLMEAAGIRLADEAREMLGGSTAGRGILILCGPGNNGGDGLAAARHLHNEGAAISIVRVGDRGAARGDALVHLGIADRMSLDVRAIATGEAAASIMARTPAPDLIIDALLGTGLDRPIEGPIGDLIDGLNRRNGTPVLSADIPSGLDADTGAVLGLAVRADVTLTFASLKPGFSSLEAQAYLGRVIVRSVGHPRSLVERLGRGSRARPPGRDGRPSPAPAPAPRRLER